MILNTSFQLLLTCKVSLEKLADSLMGSPFQVTISFSLAAFKILSLSLILGNVIMMCSSLDPTSLGLSELPGVPGSLFPLPDQGSSPSLFFQVFNFLPFLEGFLKNHTNILKKIPCSTKSNLENWCNKMCMWNFTYFEMQI